MWKNITNIALVLVVLAMIVWNRKQTKEIVAKDNAIEAAADTLHTFKTKYNSLGGYISVINANRETAMKLLSQEKEVNKDLIALLDSNRKVLHAASVGTVTNHYYSDTDTIYKDVNFSKRITDEWIDEQIDIKNGKFTRSLDYKDKYTYHLEKKDNKGLFTGSTLTSYVTPMNPNTKVTGLRSVSTVVDKRKPRIGPYVGAGLSMDKEYNIKPAIQVGIGISF